MRRLTVIILGLTLVSAPVDAAAPGAHLLGELDAFRELAGESSGWQLDGQPLDAASALFGNRLRPDELAVAAAALECALHRAEDFTDVLVETTGATLDAEIVALTFDADGTILTTVGHARSPGQLAVTFERDAYRPREIRLVTIGGHRVEVAFVEYDAGGWRPTRIAVRLDGERLGEVMR